MGNNQVKQNMKCFNCNEVSFVTIKNEAKNENPSFNLIITMECPNQKCLNKTNITLKEYFDYRHSFRSQRVVCRTCSKYEKEMFLCSLCEEKSNKKDPIVYCPKCKEKHQEENPEHWPLSLNYLNSKCYTHRNDYIAFDEKTKKNICESCIQSNDKINKSDIIFFDKIKINENDIENWLEKVKLQLAKINTIKMMNLTNDDNEKKKIKEYLQNKMYFVELEWLIIGEVVSTPNNYQTIINIKRLMENKYNTLKNNEIFNDEDPVGIMIKNILDKKNQEKKVIFKPI